MSGRFDPVAEGTSEGPLWEAEAWHGWVGYLGGPALMVAGPTRRPPVDLPVGETVMRYVRSWAQEPTDGDRSEVLDRFSLELQRVEAAS